MYPFKLVFLFSSYKYQEVKLLDVIVVLFLVFWGNSRLFSVDATPIYIPTNSSWGFYFLHILTNNLLGFFFDNNHSDRCEVIPHCVFFKFMYFIYLFLAALGLCCCARATPCCGVQASHCSGFSCCRAWALGLRASVVVACRLSSCGSRALERRLSNCGAWA